jgi:hypothetical protein
VKARSVRATRTLGVAVAVALVLASSAGFVPALAPVPVAAAAPGLTMVGAATYDVQPDVGRVAVSVRLTATNHLKDTVTRRFFFRTGYLTVLPGTSGFRITGASSKAKVSVSSATEAYTNLKIDFGANLAAGKSTVLTLDFDILDPGGAPGRPVRISRSLVSFAVWAFATPSTPGATIDVRFPAGYTVTVERGPLDGPHPEGDGHDVWSGGPLDSPLEFVADVLADRPAEYAESSRIVALAGGPATVLLRAWPDDQAWRDRVGSLVERALPVLEREIGLPWPVDGPLAVREALVRGVGGDAGVFDPATRQIDIAYAAPDGMVLHELAHAWFNGGLVADRWAAEAFASYYAGLAAAELRVDPSAPTMPGEPSAAAIPLNGWGPAGTNEPASEAWAYAAALVLAGEIAGRAGPEPLRAVWSKAARGTAAYQPGPDSAEPAAGPPDWRGLLDLVEGETGEPFDDLWREWVARPGDLATMAERAAAREHYVRTVELSGEWRLPPAVREAMRAWRFVLAGELLNAADAVLAQRARLAASAAAAGATLPPTLRAAFEGAGGVAVAAAEATVEQTTVDAIAAALAAQPTEAGFGERLIIDVGLLRVDPEASLADALASLAAGDLESAYASAQAAETAWSTAAGLGRSRILSAVLLTAALIVFIGLVRQRQRRDSAAPG